MSVCILKLFIMPPYKYNSLKTNNTIVNNKNIKIIILKFKFFNITKIVLHFLLVL